VTSVEPTTLVETDPEEARAGDAEPSVHPRHARASTLALLVVVAVVLVAATVLAAIKPVTDPDVWWVAAAGREILAHHAVPTENLFSFVDPSHPWVMHEWLFGPAYALALERFGPAAFGAITLGVLAADLALLRAGR
jgi:hypothetical protein